MLEESIAAARETLDKAGIAAKDVGRVVFVGGPTHYKPLRDAVAAALGIAPSTEVKPMTAVAEGAALFAESIDWSSQTRGRKKARGTIAAGGGKLDLQLSFQARTPDAKARVAVKLGGPAASGTEIQIDSLDTGWSSGRAGLADGAKIEVPLAKAGDNSFKVFVFDAAGGPLALERDRFAITRTAASVDAIPASHSIGIEALAKTGGGAELAYIVREGEQLPKKGKLEFKAGASLRAESADSLRFKVWEGDIAEPISDNRFVGMFEIRGRDFDSGLIAAGDRLVCEYQVLDSGNVFLEVTVPSIGNSFRSTRNLYSRTEGLRDLTQQATEVGKEVERLSKRLDETAAKVSDKRLDQARERVARASQLKPDDGNPENVGAALQNVHEARKLLAQARRDNLRAIRQIELDGVLAFFDKHVRQHARPTEVTAFENLVNTAQRSISSGSADFESLRNELRDRNFTILWRQDWFVIERFKWLAQNTYMFRDAAGHASLVTRGQAALRKDDINELRGVVNHLDAIRATADRDDDAMLAMANVVRS
jgi:molecular chaperone DnaK